MSGSNRQSLIAKVQKVLKNHYKPVKAPNERSVLEHLLYACCLENSHFEAADEGFAKLQQSYFDWNEVRVTTVTELSETLACLADPASAATRLKRCLQGIFETHYAFDLEGLRKQNLGKAVKDLEMVNGATPFVVSYVVQQALAGHAIPCSQGVFDAFELLGIITPVEAAKGRVPGLERAISKSKGCEFASLLHQFGADCFASPAGSKVRTILLEISPDAKERLPKRHAKDQDESTKSGGPRPSDAATAAPQNPSAEATDPDGSQAGERRKNKQAAKHPNAPESKTTKKAGAKKDSTDEPAAEPKKSTTKQLSRKKPR